MVNKELWLRVSELSKHMEIFEIATKYAVFAVEDRRTTIAKCGEINDFNKKQKV